MLAKGWTYAGKPFNAARAMAQALAVADPDFQWSTEDALLLRAADELTAQNGLSDPTWIALAERYENDQLIELLFVVGFYRMASHYVNTLRVQREPGVPPIPRPQGVDDAG
jgi:4-carboxymuconolactone decarboxylase